MNFAKKNMEEIIASQRRQCGAQYTFPRKYF